MNNIQILLQKRDEAITAYAQAMQFLHDNDYIGIKIAQAICLNDTTKLETYRTQYTSKLQKIDEVRQSIDQLKANMDAAEQAFQTALMEVQNEDNE